MSNSIPDLTGTNASYAVTGDVYRIFQNNQRIEFTRPVYVNSLAITVSGTSTPLIQGTDWSIAVADYTAMSQMMAISGTFSATLVKSIQINTTKATKPYSVSLNYQTLYTDVIASILASLQSIETQLALLVTPAAGTTAAPKLLALDPAENNSANLITAEVYTVNTFSGINLVLPASGSFFADSVVVTLPNGTPLINNVDYVITTCDIERTRATPNTSGVYRSILITRSYAGQLKVTYHAYGGTATLSDLTAIYQTVLNLNQYLTTTDFLSAAALGTDSVITSIVARLVNIEASIAAGA
jgi:hypothetical protein